MITTLAGLAFLAGVVILILALTGVITSGLVTLGIILAVVGGLVYFFLGEGWGTRRSRY